MSSAQERPSGTAGAGTTGSAEPTGTGVPGQRAQGRAEPDEGYREPAEYRQAGRGGRAGEHRGEAAALGGRVLAAMLMILGGLWTFFVGIIGIIRGTFFTNVHNFPFYFSVRSRGVLLLALGAVLVCAGFCVLLGMVWARMVGIVVAVLNALANFIFLPYSPLYGILMIALDVFIIWALAHHTYGRERALI